jgi:filamentous hemagglutinin family protein
MPALIRRLVSSVSVSAIALAPLGAGANPLDGHVVGGAATIAGQGTGAVTVDQSTGRAIINWGSFNIAPNETTQFIQPNASSVILNRVTGDLGASQIDGMIKATGGVYVVNPDGILFGPSATINVGSFLGTTHDIANSDFMAGSGKFTLSGNPSASIVNQGAITAANGGFASLVAPGVRNDGIITANLGTVALASGNGFTLDLYGDNLIKLQPGDAIAGNVTDVASGQTLKSLVQNTGKLKARGGTVSLTAVAAKQVLDSVINTSGLIEADSVGTKNGLVVFGAATGGTKPIGAPPQTVKVSGKISAAGKRRGTSGGKIQITGENIQLASARLDASGQGGGGKILIGGDFMGGNRAAPAVTQYGQNFETTPVPNATIVGVDAATLLDASAKGSGDGGKIVVWSNASTTFLGSALATGGALAGNGGFVETSGQSVDVAGSRVNTSASNGITGTWLLDPTDLAVNDLQAALIEADLLSTNITLQTNADGSASGLGVRSTGGAGDITINSPIEWTSGNTLTLDAYHSVIVAAPIVAGNAGGVTLITNDGGGSGGVLSFSGNGGVSFPGGGTLSITDNVTNSVAVGGSATGAVNIPAVNSAVTVLNTGVTVNSTFTIDGTATANDATPGTTLTATYSADYSLLNYGLPDIKQSAHQYSFCYVSKCNGPSTASGSVTKTNSENNTQAGTSATAGGAIPYTVAAQQDPGNWSLAGTLTVKSTVTVARTIAAAPTPTPTPIQSQLAGYVQPYTHELYPNTNDAANNKLMDSSIDWLEDQLPALRGFRNIATIYTFIRTISDQAAIGTNVNQVITGTFMVYASNGAGYIRDKLKLLNIVIYSIDGNAENFQIRQDSDESFMNSSDMQELRFCSNEALEQSESFANREFNQIDSFIRRNLGE